MITKIERLLTKDEIRRIEDSFNAFHTRFFRKTKGAYSYVIAARRGKKGKDAVEKRIVVAENLEEIWTCQSLYYWHVAGWNVKWDIEPRLFKLGEGMIGTGPKNASALTTNEETAEWIRERYIPHFAVRADDPYIGRISFNPVNFLQTAMIDPYRAEMLCKAGLSKLVESRKLMKMKESRLLPWLKAHKEMAHTATLSHILKAIDYGCDTLEEINAAEESARIRNALKRLGIPELIPQTAELRAYIQKHNVPVREYCEYLADCKNLGYGMAEKGTLCPRSFAKASGTAKSRIRAEASRKEAERRKAAEQTILAFAKKLGTMEEGGFLIKPMECFKDFIDTGNELHNCVGRYGYDEEMAKHSSYCAVVWKDGKRIECAEINPKTGEIRQLYGDHNNPSKYHGQITALVTKYALARAG